MAQRNRGFFVKELARVGTAITCRRPLLAELLCVRALELVQTGNKLAATKRPVYFINLFISRPETAPFDLTLGGHLGFDNITIVLQFCKYLETRAPGSNNAPWLHTTPL